MNKEKTLVYTDENGNEVTAEILLTYHSDQFNKDYVLFIPEGKEDEVAAAIYVQNGEEGSLEGIETEEEWSLMEDLLNDYLEKEEN